MTERPTFPPVQGLSKRTASIPGPPPRRAAAPPPTPTSEATEAPGRPQASTPRRTASTSTRNAKERVDTAPVTLSLPTPLAEQSSAIAKKTSVSYPDLVMDAIVASHEVLRELIAAANAKASSDGLFVRTRRQSAGPRSTKSFRMRRDNLEVIDQLVQDAEAESRSQLCRVAMEHYFKNGTK